MITERHTLDGRIRRTRNMSWPPVHLAVFPDANGPARESGSTHRPTTAACSPGMSSAVSQSTRSPGSAPSLIGTRTSRRRICSRAAAYVDRLTAGPDLRYRLALTHYSMLAGACNLIGGSW